MNSSFFMSTGSIYFSAFIYINILLLWIFYFIILLTVLQHGLAIYFA